MSAPAKTILPKIGPIRASMILSRIPIVVPEETKIEKQYRQYQSQLERRLMWTFPAYHYFKKGTLSEHKFLSVQKKPILKNPNVWFPKGVPDVQHNRERSQKQVVILPENDTEDKTGIMRPVEKNSILTAADKSGDLTSLERQLRHTLYLLVNYKNGGWRFPKFELENGKSLESTAEEGLRKIGGANINTWTVSKKPAGSIVDLDGSHEFFIKSHILAGRFDILKESKKEITDFAWLTRNEIEGKVDNEYFKNTEYFLNN